MAYNEEATKWKGGGDEMMECGIWVIMRLCSASSTPSSMTDVTFSMADNTFNVNEVIHNMALSIAETILSMNTVLLNMADIIFSTDRRVVAMTMGCNEGYYWQVTLSVHHLQIFS